MEEGKIFWPINSRVASSIQKMVFIEYLVSMSVIIYVLMMVIFSITDISNICYYIGIIGFLMGQYFSNGITYRLDDDQHPGLIKAFKILYMMLVLAEISMISYMIQIMPQMIIYIKVVLILLLIKNAMILLGMGLYSYLKNNVYPTCDNAVVYHKDTMRRLGRYGVPQHDYELIYQY